MKEDVVRRRQGERLQRARKAAGYRSAREAALENNWPESSYRTHEGGTRTIGLDDAERYARRFRAAGVKVTAKEILFDGEAPSTVTASTVPLVGYVGAGGEAQFLSGGERDHVPAPEGSTERTVAVEIRSPGADLDRWVVFYDDVHRQVRPDLIGKLCMIGLEDGRILLKKIAKSRARGFFHLISENEPPILDVSIEWAARVKTMTPR